MDESTGSESPENLKPTPDGSGITESQRSDSTVNATLTAKAKRRSDRSPLQRREIEDRAGGVVRCMQAMARGFEDGDEDHTALAVTAMVLAAAQDLHGRAIEAAHAHGYSNTEIAEILGVSRQAVDQMRKRKLPITKPSLALTGEGFVVLRGNC